MYSYVCKVDLLDYFHSNVICKARILEVMKPFPLNFAFLDMYINMLILERVMFIIIVCYVFFAAKHVVYS